MKRTILYIVLFNLMISLTSCELVGGIFKAGMIWGIFLVAIIIAAIMYVITRSRRK